MRNFYSIILCILFSSTMFIAQESKIKTKPVLNIIKISENFEINGKVDNPLWLKANPVELNYEIRPGDNTPATHKTYVRAMYDNEYIYFSFQCLDDNPEEIRANITERDRMFSDDYVIIALDPYGDHQRAFEFSLNPYGIQADLLATVNSEDESIDFIWFGKAEINKTGWTAEMAIPFSSMQFPTKDIHSWALSIVRNVPREFRRQISWTRVERDIPGFLSQSGKIEGLKNIQGGGGLEILPYVIGEKTGSLTDYDDPRSDMKYNPLKGRVGGSIKYKAGSDVTIDAVVNPDFSQIEADAAQIDVNTTFALSYRERRPFFLIGRELLRNPMYYSRSINNPLAAGRVIGKSGKLSYMYLGAYDRNTVFVVPGEEESSTVATDKKSFVNISRLRYELGDEDYIGGMFFTRNMKDGHNNLLGFDWRYKFTGNWFFIGEAFFSMTNELNDSTLLESDRMLGSSEKTAALDGEDYTGTGLHTVINYDGRNYNFDFVFNSFSPTYQTYNGSFNSVNYNQFFMGHSYTFYIEDSFIERTTLSLNGNLQFNYDGAKKDQNMRPRISFNMKGQSHFAIQYVLVNDEKFRNVQFNRINRFFINGSTRPTKYFTFNFYTQVGKFIYRDDNPLVGYGHDLGIGLSLLPTSQLNISLSYDRARLSNHETDELLYDGNIYRGTFKYQFSAQMFFRAILQYNSFGDSFSIYPLFSYKLNAFTTFFAGATSLYDNYGSNTWFVHTDQQFFIKLQYLFGV